MNETEGAVLVIRNGLGDESEFGVSVFAWDILSACSGRHWKVHILDNGEARELRASDLPGFTPTAGGYNPAQTFTSKKAADACCKRAERYAKKKGAK